MAALPEDADADDATPDPSATEHADAPAPGRLPGVAMFPLPGVVLLPGAILPLHVFEKRYRQMTRHILASSSPVGRMICIVRLAPGFDPMDDEPPVEEVGCCGQVVDARELDDGRFNVLVKGLRRVRITGQTPADPEILYRRADLVPLTSDKVFEIDLGEAREQMKGICRRPPIVGTPVGKQLEKLLAGPVPTAQLADVLAFDLLEDPDDKQALLENTNVRERVETLAGLLDQQFPSSDSLLGREDRFEVDD